MPLDSRKIAHISSLLTKQMAGRTQSVRLTLRTAGGGTTTLVVPAIWKPVEDADPALVESNHMSSHIGGDPDVQAVFALSDVSLSQMRACIHAELLTHGTGAEPATTYLLLSVEPRGLPPGGDRLFTRWARQS